MKINSEDYRVEEGTKVRLEKMPTIVKSYFKSAEEYQAQLVSHVEQLNSLQNKLYASGCYAVLLIFQAMDAAGKDSTIKHVLSGVNPQGCDVHSFKKPTTEELEHDFLWRTERKLPARGEIGIFNRSYYEEVLVVRVHPEILHSQRIPDKLIDEKSIWSERYRSITDFEKHLYRNGTKIVKFFLHVSKDEQRKRFLKRIDEPAKNWKFNAADIEERKLWNEYMHAYEQCIATTSNRHAPWYVVPADDKHNMQIIVSQIVVDTLKSLQLAYPTPSKQLVAELRTIRKQLEK